MNTDPHDPLNRWLAAERDDSADREAEEMAEAALLELFEMLPPLSPPSGFADRVMRRVEATVPAPLAQIPPAGWAVRLVRSLGFRVAVGGGVMATALALLWLPELFLAIGRLVTLGDVVGLGTASVVDLGRWLTLAARIGEWLLTVGGALAVSLTSPAAVKVTAACLAISGISFVALRDLMTRDRSWSHVDPVQ